MMDQELRHLTREDLLDIIYELQRRTQQVEQENETIRKQLADRTVKLEKALNGVFEAAQAAADQYLAQVHAANEQSQQLADRIVADAQRKATAIVQQAQQEADRIRAMTDEGTQQKWAELQEKTDTMLQSYEALRLALQK